MWRGELRVKHTPMAWQSSSYKGCMAISTLWPCGLGCHMLGLCHTTCLGHKRHPQPHASNEATPKPSTLPAQDRWGWQTKTLLQHTPKPSSWPHVNGPAASITTSKVATSLPWQASSTAYSSCKDPSLWKENKVSSGAEDDAKFVEVGTHKVGHRSGLSGRQIFMWVGKFW